MILEPPGQRLGLTRHKPFKPRFTSNRVHRGGGCLCAAVGATECAGSVPLHVLGGGRQGSMDMSMLQQGSQNGELIPPSRTDTDTAEEATDDQMNNCDDEVASYE